MAGRRTTRAEDERDLAWLRMKERGMTSGQIGRRFGETASKVRVAMTRINAAYRASTGDAEDVFGVRRVE